MRFDELDLEDEILDGLEDMNFHEMTPVQEYTIPVILEGRDIIGCAQTGTGKTAAYTLPLLNKLLLEGNPDNVVKSLIIVPTRELAQQIDQQFQGFSYYAPLSTTVVYGGGDGKGWDIQKNGMLNGADVVIATPGRMIAHLQNSGVDLSHVEYLILDEADRMLDMGFYDDIMQIVRRLPKERQTMLFSATMPPKIQQLAADILTDPAEIKLAVSRPADRIRQRVAFCGEDRKMALLRKVLSGPEASRVIVFASSKLKVKQLARELRGAGRKIGEMHSDLEQSRREEVMLDFKSGRIGVLVATDIVARGIDIDDISMVINYDVPHDAEDYVHRIGRTARAEADGAALTMVGERDRRRWTGIERFLGKPVERLEGFEGTKKHTDTDAGKGKTGRSNAKPAQNRAPKKKRAAADTHVEKPQTDTPAEKLEADSIAVETTKSRKKRSQPWWRRRKKGTAKAENANPENVKTDNI